MNREKDRIRAVSPNKSDGPGAELPQLVSQIRDNALSILGSYLDQLFAACDDLFFDLSSRATNNNEQNLYFESMRELRIKKNGIHTQFRQGIEQNFSDCRTIPSPSQAAHEHSTAEETLSLVQHDEIEQEVAINSMISKARATNQEALHQLHIRLDYLIPENRIDATNNPLDPQQICKSFARACELLDVNVKAKIILYKQFERLVVSRLANIYSNANDLLVNAGVIPRISRSVNKSRSATKPQQGQSDQSQESLQDGDYQQSQIQFDELAHLLSTIRSLNFYELPGFKVYSANPGPVMNNHELLAAITLLQQQFNVSNNELYIHKLISEVLSQSNPKAPQSIKQTDEDTINLVAMFFDFVLGEGNLPSAVQALVGRLQIPILKVALKDRSFFNNSNHPARSLVNRLAEISIGLEDGDRLKEDATFQLVASIVKDIQENYSVDSGVFASRLQQLEQHAAKSKHRSELIEKRTSQAETGKAKTEEARQATQSLLLEKLIHRQIPVEISDFLVHQWQQVLTLTHLKFGENSHEWINSVQVVQDLLWACQPLLDEKSQERLLKMKEALIAQIKSGLREASISSAEAEETTALITGIIDRFQSNHNPPLLQPLNHEQARSLGHTPGAGTKSWKDMSALERQQSRHKQLTYEFIKRAEELPLNSWLMYEDIGSGQKLKCKLSARIEPSDSYLFVNRLGFKVLKKSRKDFAYDMQKGRVQLVPSEPLFDRAMSRIRSTLAKPSTPPPTAS